MIRRGSGMELLILVALCYLSDSVSADDKAINDETRTAVKFLAESYLEYRASFPKLKVTFQWTEAKAESADHALQGEFTGQAEPVDCLLITAPGRRRYDFLCGPKAQAEFLKTLHQRTKSGSNNMVAVKCLSTSLLEGDGYALRLSVSGGSANLYVPGGEINDGVRISPFNLETMGADGISDPARYLNDALGGRFQYEYLGATQADRPDLTVAVISERLRDEFSFDPTRAYLLSRNVSIDRRTSRRVHEMRVLSAVECSDGRWLPERGVKILFPDDPQAMRIFVLQLLEYDADYDASPADWELQIPPDTQISVAGEVQWTRTPKEAPERFGPTDFPKLHERCVAQGKKYEERRRTAAEIAGGQTPGPSNRASTWRIILGANFVLALSVACYFFWRWRKRLPPNRNKG